MKGRAPKLGALPSYELLMTHSQSNCVIAIGLMGSRLRHVTIAAGGLSADAMPSLVEPRKSEKARPQPKRFKPPISRPAIDHGMFN